MKFVTFRYPINLLWYLEVHDTESVVGMIRILSSLVISVKVYLVPENLLLDIRSLG